jgi:hypothetical protein
VIADAIAWLLGVMTRPTTFETGTNFSVAGRFIKNRRRTWHKRDKSIH